MLCNPEISQEILTSQDQRGRLLQLIAISLLQHHPGVVLTVTAKLLDGELCRQPAHDPGRSNILSGIGFAPGTFLGGFISLPCSPCAGKC